MTYPENQPPAPAPQGYWPPQPTPAPAFAPAPTPPPVKSRKDFWLKGPGIIVLIVAGGLLLFGIYAATGGLKPASADAEVNVVSCKVGGSDSLPTATVGITVKNTGSKTRSFSVNVEYRDGAGNRIDTDTARVRSVAPGDTARVEETTILDAAPDSAGACAIVGVR